MSLYALLVVIAYLIYIGIIKWRNKKYPTVGTIPKSNRKIVERGKMDTPQHTGPPTFLA
jgi:cell division protein FtsL